MRQLLRAITLVEQVVGDLLEVSKMGPAEVIDDYEAQHKALHQKCVSQASKVRMFRVIDLDDTPRVPPPSDRLTVDHDLFFGADNGKWHQCP